MRSDSSPTHEVRLPTGVVRVQARLNLNMSNDFHRSRVKQTDPITEPLIRCLTKEPPIASSHALKGFLLYPAFPFAGMASLRPLPQHSEYRRIISSATFLPPKLMQLVIDKVSKTYRGSVQALRSFSLTLGPRELPSRSKSYAADKFEIIRLGRI